jgi:amidohydrolase
LVDKAGSEIEDYAMSVRNEPEMGFKETKTAAKTAAFFRKLGFQPEEGLALTGVRARLNGKSGGPTIAILGELDAITVPSAPHADPLTGAAHQCGHFLQLGAMMGAATALSQVFKDTPLAGNLVFFAVPAEEYVELEYRQKLRAQGKIHYLGGKEELIYRDEFRGVDMAMMIHSAAESPEASVEIGQSSNGFIGKTIRYIGKESHAAAAPEAGINALDAAMLGLMAINALRTTFRDEDHVRVHPIITKGGDLVNVIPADVRIETYVRAKTMEAIDTVNAKVDKALKAGADAMGAKCEITTMPGYLPLTCPEEMNSTFIENAKIACPQVKIKHVDMYGGSTDMGDISQVMPAIHPYIGGVVGNQHTPEFDVVDFKAACLLPAKALAMSVVDFLWDDAALAKKIIAAHKPAMTMDEYKKYMDKYFS